LQDINVGRCVADLPRDGGDLLSFYDGRRLSLPAPARRLGPRWLDTTQREPIYDYAAPGASQGCTQNATILADLVGAVFERVGWHRRYRHGVANATGDLRRQADRASRTGL